MDDDAIREYVVRSRAEQGLPPTITDEAVLAKVAALLTARHGEEPAGARRARPPAREDR